MTQIPTVGRIVHTRYDNQVCAAIIVYAGPLGFCNLAVFDNQGGLHPRQDVESVESVTEPGAEGWTWPPYVAPAKAETPAAVTVEPLPAMPAIPDPPADPAPAAP